MNTISFLYTHTDNFFVATLPAATVRDSHRATGVGHRGASAINLPLDCPHAPGGKCDPVVGNCPFSECRHDSKMGVSSNVHS